MTGTLITAIITITLALVFYTIGVWSEHRSKQLKKIHLIFFWLGLCMDTTGTILMGRIAKQSMFSGKLSLHGVTGTLAIVLMIVHAIWATIVLIKNNEDSAKNFHRLSIAVWVILACPIYSWDDNRNEIKLQFRKQIKKPCRTSDTAFNSVNFESVLATTITNIAWLHYLFT